MPQNAITFSYTNHKKSPFKENTKAHSESSSVKELPIKLTPFSYLFFKFTMLC